MITYNNWHRTLGYSYFAMDIDYIEIRNDVPVAAIETTLCTVKLDNPKVVFNRFLNETNGFQFEVLYWCAKWLDIPAFIVCDECIGNFKSLTPKFNILSLDTGQAVKLEKDEYIKFLNKLPNYSDYFNGKKLTLPELLESLKDKYEGIKVYPYFSNNKKAQWNNDFRLRCKEIDENIMPTHKEICTDNKTYPVKGEITYNRPEDYVNIRRTMGGEFLNLEWVEWRKNNIAQKIGRPNGLVRTMYIDCETHEKFKELSKVECELFMKTKERLWWDTISQKMNVNWYLVQYMTNDKNEIELLNVWIENKSYIRTIEEYTKWIKRM